MIVFPCAFPMMFLEFGIYDILILHITFYFILEKGIEDHYNISKLGL